MSTCPSKDLYSAFVDGEVPSPWKEKLEAHLEICSECKKTVESYKNLKEKIQNSKTPEINLEDSFARLESRKLSKKIRDEKAGEKANWFTRSVKVPIPAFAAAVFLFVFVPLIIISTQKTTVEREVIVSNFTPIMPTKVASRHKNSKQFNFTPLNTINLNAIGKMDDSNNKALNFNHLINLDLPIENNENEELLLSDFNIIAVFSQNRFQSFDIDYNEDGK